MDGTRAYIQAPQDLHLGTPPEIGLECCQPVNQQRLKLILDVRHGLRFYQPSIPVVNTLVRNAKD
jgi:hypothetical protein